MKKNLINIAGSEVVIDMELRNRTIGEETEVEDEEVALIETSAEAAVSDSEVVDSGIGKSGIAGDERNILVLLFLYVLQVNTPLWHVFRSIINLICPGHTPWLGSCHPPDTDQQECELQTAGRVQLRILAILSEAPMGPHW